MKILLLLPAYNEEASISSLLGGLVQVLEELHKEYAIIVCDDGSKDKTAEEVQKFCVNGNVVLMQHKYNRGLGETARDLFEYAVEHTSPDDVIIRMDCDDSHKPDFIPALLAKIEEGRDVVIASRFQKGGGQAGVPTHRQLISRCANMFMKVVFWLPEVREYSCGFRAYRAEIIHSAIKTFGNNFIQLKGLGFTGTLEKLLKLHLLGARFGEVPFVLRYDHKQSDSKMVLSITTLGYFIMAVVYHWPFGGWKSQMKRSRQNL